MNNLKKKVQGFVEENKTKIIVGGMVIGTVAYKMHIYNIRKEAFMRGSIIGFQETINWFDRHFDDVNLRQLWEGWAKANPDKVRYL